MGKIGKIVQKLLVFFTYKNIFGKFKERVSNIPKIRNTSIQKTLNFKEHPYIYLIRPYCRYYLLLPVFYHRI